jgi:hypothetical protein
VSPTRQHNTSQASPSLSTGSGHRLTKPRRSSAQDALLQFQPLQNDLLTDLDTIDKLTEVRTEIGLARAFVRLSLEKKLLGEHVKQLLNDGELLRCEARIPLRKEKKAFRVDFCNVQLFLFHLFLPILFVSRALYKRHAFLRQEEEREQFIYHLKSLTVVDFFCFSNHFRSIPTNYTVLLVPSKKFSSSTTSANAYIKLFGTIGDSNVSQIPKNAFQFMITV